MSKKWYVVHAYSGFEKSVQRALAERIQRQGMQDKFGQVLVPVEEVVEMKSGQKSTSERKFFPGYVLVEMEMDEESWHLVKNTPKVTGFVGGGTKPSPIPEQEVLRITNQIATGTLKPVPRIAFDKGETIKINDGPFQNFTGVIDEIDPARGKLKISVSIFGRSTPVELEYWQVERA